MTSLSSLASLLWCKTLVSFKEAQEAMRKAEKEYEVMDVDDIYCTICHGENFAILGTDQLLILKREKFVKTGKMKRANSRRNGRHRTSII